MGPTFFLMASIIMMRRDGSSIFHKFPPASPLGALHRHDLLKVLERSDYTRRYNKNHYLPSHRRYSLVASLNEQLWLFFVHISQVSDGMIISRFPLTF